MLDIIVQVVVVCFLVYGSLQHHHDPVHDLPSLVHQLVWFGQQTA